MTSRNETFNSINEWQQETFPTATLDGIYDHIQEEWIEFTTEKVVGKKIYEAVDLIILLSAYIDKATNSEGAQCPVNTKMAVNRQRSWNIKPDGTGRHILKVS